jgi:U3 small nucleolar RNA-associated protein 21
MPFVAGSTILQVLKMESAITSLSLAPAMDILVTTHVEKRGIYAWANELIFGALESITASNKPIVARLPVSSSERKRLEGTTGNQGHAGVLVHSAGSAGLADDLNALGESQETPSSLSEISEGGASSDEDISSDGPNRQPTRISSRDQQVLAGKAPVAPAMITLSMLPRSQWLNMIHIDSIKTRNKPIEPPKKPEAAPFFLPTATGVNAGRDPVFVSEEDQERIRQAAEAAWGDDEPTADDEIADGRDGQPAEVRETHVHAPMAGKRANDSAPMSLTSLLQHYESNKTWKPVLDYLKSLSPSKLDIQLRTLDAFEFGGAPDGTSHDEQDDEGGEDQERSCPRRIKTFMLFLADAIASSMEFEFLQALLRAFLLIHGSAIVTHQALKGIAETIEHRTHASWGRIRSNVQKTQCIVGILQNNHY